MTLSEDELTIATVLSRLESLCEEILEILDGEPLMVPLERMDIMYRKNRKLESADVLWVGPDTRKGELGRSKETRVLERVTDLIRHSLKIAGYFVDRRPSFQFQVNHPSHLDFSVPRHLISLVHQLHATIMNTRYLVHAVDKSERDVRWQFSYLQVLEALGLTDEVLPLRAPPPAPGEAEQASKTRILRKSWKNLELTSVPMDLGMWPVSEVQICELRGFGPQDE
ncbi:hypothetical protein BDV98DRAFT_593102 [Pterulicium gracile]|uniref:A-kinase anchor protein 7-like phosphoesterase domain-containing protein n=1 Tax=Pterulicium gracile TaxID=1884261 RepID=A0A5C3QLV6_9AGAR|nr:hypothetical protein BDV98DRAFT_593102 [Pterula gracilis]